MADSLILFQYLKDDDSDGQARIKDGGGGV